MANGHSWWKSETGIKEDAIFIVLLAEIASPLPEEVSRGSHALLQQVLPGYRGQHQKACGEDLVLGGVFY